MTRRLLLATLLLVSGSTALHAQIAFDSNLIPKRRDLERVGLQKHWLAVVPLGIAYEQVKDLSLAEDMLFVQTNNGNLHAFQAETGRYLWGKNLGPATGSAFPASLNSDRVFVSHLSTLYCLDRGTGREIWRAKLEKSASSPTAADEENVIVGLTSGKVVCHAVRDHTRDTSTGRSAGSFLWAWKTDGTVTGRPIPANKVIAFASQDSRAYVAHAESDLLQPPKLLFRYLAGGPISASMAPLGERTLLAPSEDGNLYAFDLFTGETKWITSAGDPIEHEPLVARDDIFIISKAGRFISVDAETGTQKWSVQSRSEGAQILAIGDKRIYARSGAGRLVIGDRATGQILNEDSTSGLNLREFSANLTNGQNDRIYLSTPNGLLICVKEAGRLQPTPLRDPEARPFGYIPEQDVSGTPPESPPADDLAAPAENVAPAFP